MKIESLLKKTINNKNSTTVLNLPSLEWVNKFKKFKRLIEISRLHRKLISLLITSVFLLSSLPNNKAFAIAYYEGIRDSSWEDLNNYGGNCSTGKIEFNPLTENKDLLWEIDNPTCIAYIAASGAAMSAIDQAASYFCLEPFLAAENAAQIASGVPMSPKTIKSIAKQSAKCGSLLSAQNYVNAAACCGGVAANITGLAVATGALAIIYDRANTTFKKARICGHDWNNWINEEKQDFSGIVRNIPQFGKNKKSYAKCLDNIFQDSENICSLGQSGTNSVSDRDIKNKYFREYIYAGKEYEYNGSLDCKNPKNWSDDKRFKILGYNSNAQRYYMKGPNSPSNYACDRFIINKGTRDEINSGKEAFECCKRASQESLCLENNDGISNTYESKFCTFGSRCESKAVWFSIYQAKSKSDYLCAKTYSVCPYNHLLGGGTEKDCSMGGNECPENQDYNTCQYMKHCIKIPDRPYIKVSDLGDSYISSACRDFKGDSQNSYGYNSDMLQINTKHFSAPIAQCFKETMENMFLNKAGFTKCRNPAEEPKDGECESGYIFKKGDRIQGPSFFQNIQDRLRGIIKLVLTLAVVMMGITILLGGKMLGRKEISIFLIKIGLVGYFATGTAWQDNFFDGVYSSSAYISSVFMRIDESKESFKLDGCQFPRYDYKDLESGVKSQLSEKSYPPGKEYLKIWDTLDCKIAMTMGFGPEASVPNLFLMILGGFLTGGLGIIFLLATFVFAFFLLALTVRALHIFLMSLVSIVLLIYISPITICAALFRKTEKIFKNWWGNLLGFILQPVILFAYLGVMITIFDSIIIGDAQFTKTNNDNPPKIECAGKANDTSIYCIFRIAEIKKFTGFEPIGIGLPMLYNVNQTKLASIVKAALIVFVLTSILDTITRIASKLVGGLELSSQTKGAAEMLGKAYGGIRAVQSRAIGAAFKHGKGAAKLASRAATRVKTNIGDFGKKNEIRKNEAGEINKPQPPAPADIIRGGSDNKDNSSAP